MYPAFTSPKYSNGKRSPSPVSGDKRRPNTSFINSLLMEKVPSLVTLSIWAVKRELLLGVDIIPHLNELPSHLFDSLVNCLPPLALQKLQSEMPFKNDDDYDSTSDCLKIGRKRRRKGNFDVAWMTLFKLRWPELFGRVQTCDWQQIYWETHLQNCLDEAAELALLPSFSGCLGEIKVSDSVLKYIGYEKHMENSTSEHSKLRYHCLQFGFYARCLRLHNVLCVPESSQLLRNCKLQSLMIRCIRSAEHVDGMCKLLSKNRETLTSLEFVHCKISSSFVDTICSSLHIGDGEAHQIQNFSISTSNFLETNMVSLAHGLASFLSSGRSLSSLKLCDNHLDWKFARTVFRMLLEASSNLSVLDLSENNMSGWLSDFSCRSSVLLSSTGASKPLQSLRVLNLRGNNLRIEDAVNLRYALLHMPSLEVLDLSDNPIEDDGIRSLIPYFTEDDGRCFPLSTLNLENCELSCDGAKHLLETLSTLERPLTSLSIADNSLGSEVAAALGKFLSTSILVLNIEGIGLGPSGFRELKEALTEKLKLVELNISKNRGGTEVAKFLSKLLLWAPELCTVNAAYNLMPGESLTFICSALEAAKGRVERLDLTGNFWDYQPAHSSTLTKFQHNGRPILILPSQVTSDFPYDDDP